MNKKEILDDKMKKFSSMSLNNNDSKTKIYKFDKSQKVNDLLSSIVKGYGMINTIYVYHRDENHSKERYTDFDDFKTNCNNFNYDNLRAINFLDSNGNYFTLNFISYTLSIEFSNQLQEDQIEYFKDELSNIIKLDKSTFTFYMLDVTGKNWVRRNDLVSRYNEGGLFKTDYDESVGSKKI